MAEGLAQACVHRDEYLIPIMFDIEKVSTAHCERWTLVDIFTACRVSPDLKSSVKFDDFDKIEKWVVITSAVEHYCHGQSVEGRARRDRSPNGRTSECDW